jgi:ribosomal protein S18 acetylase RimI-like enzyme
MSATATYLTRHRMEITLGRLAPVPELPEGFFWVPWDAKLLDVFAEVHYLSFRDTLDAQLFRSFGNRAGCWHVMNEIHGKAGFLPLATWLIAGAKGCCACIQGIAVTEDEGGIQNVAVLPRFRGQGLGRALVLQTLHGFAGEGLRRATLEVTAENGTAFLLYQRLGFRKIDTSYKEIFVE